VLNDGVTLVTGDHADIEKSPIFGITHGLEQVFAVIPIVLRRLNDRDRWFDELGGKVAQPVGSDHVIAVDYGYHHGIR